MGMNLAYGFHDCVLEVFDKLECAPHHSSKPAYILKHSFSLVIELNPNLITTSFKVNIRENYGISQQKTYH